MEASSRTKSYAEPAAVTSNDNLDPTERWDPDYRPTPNQLCSLCLSVIESSEVLNLWSKDKAYKVHADDPGSPDDRDMEDCPGEGIVEQWNHHASPKALQQSAVSGCHLCALLYIQSTEAFLEETKREPLPPGQLSLHATFESNSASIATFGIQDAVGDFERSSLRSLVPGDDIDSMYWPANPESSWWTATTASEATMDLARAWLKVCKEGHNECSFRGEFPRIRPKRLLELCKLDGENLLRLVEMPPDEPDVEYLTLSHCWGKKPLLKLVKDNHRTFQQDIPVEQLPPTFRDAVDITIRLGFRFLWIDALCIIQDDAEDWRMEIPNMGYIYGNCICTIAALSSVDSQGGCYAQRYPLAHVPCEIRTKGGGILHLGSGIAGHLKSRWTPFGHTGPSGGAPLQTRAWVVQERALSPRTLYFSGLGIYWECRRTSHAEVSRRSSDQLHGGPNHVSRLKIAVGSLLRSEWRGSSDRESADAAAAGVGKKSKWKAGDKSREARLIKEMVRRVAKWRYQQNSKEMVSWHGEWRNLVENYSGCNLTNASDKWPAISGIAKVFESVAGSPNVAGMWQSRMLDELLWRRHPHTSTRRRLTGQPSWSWLSIDGAVRMMSQYPNVRYTAIILRISNEEGVQDEGAHASCVKVRAPFARVDVQRAPPPMTYDFGADAPVCESLSPKAVLEQIAQGEWIPDAGQEVENLQEMWALQLTTMIHEPHDELAKITLRTVQGLIVRPDTEEGRKWRRLGMFEVYVASQLPELSLGVLEPIGEQSTIELH